MAPHDPEPLTKQQRKAIGYIEGWWYLKKELPDEVPGVSREALDSFLKNKNFKTALSSRGIPSPSEAQADLTDEQIAAITAVINFTDRRSRSRKLSDMGINPTKWAGWMRNPKFVEFLHSVSSDEFHNNIHVAHEGLMKAVDRGSESAVKYYMELTGRSATPTEHNLRLVLSRLVESIQLHVKDPDTIRAIESDFAAIMDGSLTGRAGNDYESPTPSTLTSRVSLIEGI